jgi:hypothetical protein
MMTLKGIPDWERRMMGSVWAAEDARKRNHQAEDITKLQEDLATKHKRYKEYKKHFGGDGEHLR